jgi:hypothetical protein
MKILRLLLKKNIKKLYNDNKFTVIHFFKAFDSVTDKTIKKSFDI